MLATSTLLELSGGLSSIDGAVVLLSGGLDSATALALVRHQSPEAPLLALSFNYGQRHTRELESAKRIADYYGVEHLVLNLPVHAFSGSKSPLVDPRSQMPHSTYQELQQALGPSPTYVPFRNGIFLSFGAAVGLSRDLRWLVISSHAEDARNYAYPDCSGEFNEHMGMALFVGTYYEISLQAPFERWTKSEILRVGLSLGVPYELTWSCYEGGEKACGECPTCISRLEAFRQVDSVDPVSYL